MTGILSNICISKGKGTPKHKINSAKLIEDYGIEGDAHAGFGHRQISMLAVERIDEMKAKGLDLKPGAFGENLIVEDIEFENVGIGSTLRIDDVQLEITQIGKECHDRCAIYYSAGDCIMPRSGLFARVIQGGEVSTGMPVSIESLIDRQTAQCAVITISDTCSQGKAVDTAGPAVCELVKNKLNSHIALTKIIPDDANVIVETLKNFGGRSINLILTAGGTGCGPRDVTPEATRIVIQREVPGLAQVMLQSSLQFTPHAMLQRGIAGIFGSTLIVNLPGSKKAATENLQAIIPGLKHAVRHLSGDTDHVEIDPERINMKKLNNIKS